jgi:hypothetical protein
MLEPALLSTVESGHEQNNLDYFYFEDWEEEVSSNLATMLLTKGGKSDGLLTFVN